MGNQKKDQTKTMVTQSIIQNLVAMGQNASSERAGKGEQDAVRRSQETSGNLKK